jgi:hypothetical protein
MLAAMPGAAARGIVGGMEQTPTQDYQADFDLGADCKPDEEAVVRAWRAEQLVRLGILPLLADAFADTVDWHELATLVGRGCPLMLAFEIAR